MTKLMIKDLSKTTELDGAAMTAVCGGRLALPLFPVFSSYSSRVDFSAAQEIGQVQKIENANGNNVAFADDIKSVIKPTQRAQNNINLGGGFYLG